MYGFLSPRLGCVVTRQSSKNQIGTTRFSDQNIQRTLSIPFFLSFRGLRYDFASHNSPEKPILTFFCILSWI